MLHALEILRHASRDYMLRNTTPDEQIDFIRDQIRDPMDAGDSNYAKELPKMYTDKDELDEICKKLLVEIEDIYPHLKIDISEYEQRLYPLFKAIYQFFVRRSRRLMYIFIREYLFTNKNRKGLVENYSAVKTPSYPKEQYGKRDFFILVTKLEKIVNDIFDDDIRIKKFINYIEKNDKSPVWLDTIREATERGYIVDDGVIDDMFALFKKADTYRSDLNKLEMEITQGLIIPYMQDNGMMEVRTPPLEEAEEPLDDEGEDEDEA